MVDREDLKYTKSELGFESPRLWSWEARLKLLMIATMVFAFLLPLLQLSLDTVRGHLLKQWFPRTGESTPRGVELSLALLSP